MVAKTVQFDRVADVHPAISLILVIMPEKAAVKTEARLYGGHLSRSTIRECKSSESNVCAFLTMSAQNEADKAISMFNRSVIQRLEAAIREIDWRELTEADKEELKKKLRRKAGPTGIVRAAWWNGRV